MSKFPGALALPGLVDKRHNRSSSRASTSPTEAKLTSCETDRRTLTSTVNNEELSCFLNDRGEFMPQDNSTLTHLTKLRPKSPARRPARHRERSPESWKSSRDDFEYYAGLKTDRELVEQSKQSNGNTGSKINHQRDKLQRESRQNHVVAYDDDRINKNITLHDSLNSCTENINMDSQDECNISDDDLGDMLIGDYIDSDESNIDEKPSPRSTDTNLQGASKLFPSLTSQADNSANIGLEKTSTKLFPSLSEPEERKVASGTTNQDSTFKSNYHSSTTKPFSNQSSARRRRFKPVSIDNVESNGTSINDRNRLVSSLDETNTRKENSWGLRTGSLGSSFAESTLKSGTIFDKFLKDSKNSQKSDKVMRDGHIIPVISVSSHEQKTEDKQSISENRKNTTVGSPKLARSKDEQPLRYNENSVVVNTAPQEHRTVPSHQSLSRLLSGDDNSDEDSSLALSDDSFKNDENNLTEDESDEEEDDLNNTVKSTNNLQRTIDYNSSDNEEGDTTFVDSLGSVTDTQDISIFSPGEIPQYYQPSFSSGNQLYPPPLSYNGLDGQKSQDSEPGESEDDGMSEGSQTYNDDMLADDTLVPPPGLFDEDEEGNDLFEPPPMFASDDEEDDDDFVDIPPPPLPLLPVQTKKVMPFHKIPLGDWTEDDALEWLQYVGLGHFKEQFKAHHVNGRTLKDINFQLLEEIGISAPDERELLLSEIYELDHPSEEENLEAEIQDALETASEQDKEKILAVLTALRSPTLSRSIEVRNDSDQGQHLSSDTASMTSSITASDDHSNQGSSGITPSQSELYLSDDVSIGKPHAKATKEKSSKSKLSKKLKKKEKKEKKQKKSFSKFWESLSISHTSSKLTKVFGSKKFNPAMQYLLQAGPQGILRVWPTSISGQTKYCSFMVSMTTTSSQVVRLVLDKYDIVADPLRYFLCEVGLGKGGVDQALGGNDCPLTWQCRWNDPEKYRFEMRCHNEGSVRMLFELDEYKDDLDYRSIAVSSKTPCKDILPLIVKKYDLPGNEANYQLMEVSEDNEDIRRVVMDHVCPLQLQKAWYEPDHVFRLVRKNTSPPEVKNQNTRALTLAEDCSEDVIERARTHSTASSLRDGYETDSTDQRDNTSEEAVDLPPISKELEEVVMEVQDSIQQAPQLATERTRSVSLIGMEKQLEQLKQKDGQLVAKDKEIEKLKKERDLLLEKESELMVWRMRNSELVEREEELERLQEELQKQHELPQNDQQRKELELKCQELMEKSNDAKELKEELETTVKELEATVLSKDEEISERNKEIERLYTRNSELDEKEKEIKELNNKVENLTKLQKEYDILKMQSSSSVSLSSRLETKIVDLESEKESLQKELQEVRNSVGREMNSNKENIDKMRLEMDRLQDENRQIKLQSDDLKRRNELLEKSSKLLDSLRQENKALLEKTKETNDLKRNIIRLTSQLREADNLRLNQGELDDLKLRLSICEAEKQQVQSRLDESERRNMTLMEDISDVNDLRKRYRTLQEKEQEQEMLLRNLEVAHSNDKLAFQEKSFEAQNAEKRLSKELNIKDGIIKQKDTKIEEMNKKIKSMTDAAKKMENKFRDQREQRENLGRLLTIIKDKDPSLLRTLHRSIVSEEEEKEDEEWC